MEILQYSYFAFSLRRNPLILFRDGIHLSAGRVLAEVLMAISLAGCAVGPDFKAIAPPKDQAYVRQPISISSGETEQRLVMGANLPVDWWTLLQSAQLNHVVRQALANNWSLTAARANLAKAAEGVAVARRSFPAS